MGQLMGISHDIPLSMAVQKTIEKISSNATPETILDSMTEVGIVNPLQQQIVRRHITAMLKPGGSHHHLTVQKKWLVSGERWAIDLGLSKGKSVAKFVPRIDAIEEYRDNIDTNASLPPEYRDSANGIFNILTTRAGKRLDEASIMNIMEAQKAQAATVAATMEKAERRHAEQMLELSQDRAKLLEGLVNRLTKKNQERPDLAAE